MSCVCALMHFLLVCCFEQLSHCMPSPLPLGTMHDKKLMGHTAWLACGEGQRSNRHCSNPLLQALCPTHPSLYQTRLLPLLLGLLFAFPAGEVRLVRWVSAPSSPLQREGQGKVKGGCVAAYSQFGANYGVDATNGKGAATLVSFGPP